MNSLPIVTIVGRPNVGKSTLFNRLVGKRAAVVHDIPGVTRDRNYAQSVWNGRSFLLVDTGGFIPLPEDRITAGVKRQIEIALAESDIVLFLVDLKSGLNPLDKEIGRIVRKNDQPTLLVVNKVDSIKSEESLSEFYTLGFDNLIPVSSLHGRNIGNLLDLIVSKFKPAVKYEELPCMKFAVVGRPNVGKSSFVNTILGEDRVLVDEQPGTTRDSIDTKATYRGKELLLIDTAGLRRKSKIKSSIEYYTILRSLKAIERCDIALILIDAEEGVTIQDQRIIALSEEKGKGMVLVVNKIDKVESKQETLEIVKRKLFFIDWIPVVLTSVTLKKGIFDVLDIAIGVYEEGFRRITKNELATFLKRLTAHHSPPVKGKRRLAIKRLVQTQVKPPVFSLSVNFPDLVTNNYLKYLKNSIRRTYLFTGVPFKIKICQFKKQ